MERSAELFQGEAERLPFRDAIFDVVFVGSINFFNDRVRAIAETIRVAKPGTKIVIGDETEKVAKDIYEKTPLTRKYFQKRQTAVVSPGIWCRQTCWESHRRRSATAGCIACLSASHNSARD